MKLLASLLTLTAGILPAAFFPATAHSQSSSTASIVGVWQGFAIVHETQQVPIKIRIARHGSELTAEFLNGPADHPDAAPASSVTLDGTHLLASFDYYARTLDATLIDGKLTGTYGATHPTAKSASPLPFQATRLAADIDPASAPNPPDISGSWEIATKSSKGESAWDFARTNQPASPRSSRPSSSASTATPAGFGARGTAPVMSSATSPRPAPLSTRSHRRRMARCESRACWPTRTRL